MIETDVATITEMLKGFALGFGLDLLGAVLILIVGWWAAGRAAALVRHSLKNTKFVDATLKPLASSIVRYVILIFVIVAVLSNFGVETTSIIAVLGAAGLAIGLALQGTLSNIAAGVMILILRPLKIDEFIEAGSISGTVVEITLFTTLLKTPDGVFISAPNSQIWNSAIKTIRATQPAASISRLALPMMTMLMRPSNFLKTLSHPMNAYSRIRNR